MAGLLLGYGRLGYSTQGYGTPYFDPLWPWTPISPPDDATWQPIAAPPAATWVPVDTSSAPSGWVPVDTGL